MRNLEQGTDTAAGAPGQPIQADIEVVSNDGSPIAAAEGDVWQADEDGLYDVQYAGLEQRRARSIFRTDRQGRLSYRTIVPTAYPVPTDGPVGKMLVAPGRPPWRPAHVHFLIKSDGYEALVTHLFRDGDPYLDSDVVFGVRSSLVVPIEGTRQSGAPAALRYRFVLNRSLESQAAR